MEGAIQANYLDGYTSALQRLTRLLDNLDEVDRSIADLETRAELAVSGDADVKKTRKLQAEVEERRVQREELLAAAEKVSRLEPKPLVRAPAAK